MAIERVTAADLMTPKPITVAPDAPLGRAIGVMRQRRIHELPVLDQRRFVGMITFDSIARRTGIPFTTKVEHLMVLPPIFQPSTPFSELCEQLLATGLRAAPVVGKKGELLGIISRTDLVRALIDDSAAAKAVVDSIVSPPGVVLREDEAVGTLFSHLRTLEEHPLPVVDRKGRLTGAVGVADLGGALWRPLAGGKRDAQRRSGVFNVQVKSIMRSPALTVPEGTRASEAARRMTAERTSSVFVVDASGRPTGVVAQTDLLGLAVGRAGPSAREVGDVYVQIHGLRGSADPAVLTEIDRVIARGIRRVARHARPILLSLHITPHATHRTGEASVQARLHSDRGILYASQTGWNYFLAISDVMDELAEQARRQGEERRGRRRGNGAQKRVEDDSRADPELEARIRAATSRDE